MLIDDTRRPARGPRTSAEIDQIQTGLRRRYDELAAEYTSAVAQSRSLSREQLADAAADEADIGANTAERDREVSVIRAIGERRDQVGHALQRLAAGAYGWCESCGTGIPVERLGVFPWATSCVRCQEARERRAA